MKELETLHKIHEAQGTEILAQEREIKELKYIGSLIPQTGHRVWEINESTLSVKEAQFKEIEEVPLFAAFEGDIKKEILVKPGHAYISALSKKSALDRYMKGKGSAIKAKGKQSLNPFTSKKQANISQYL